MRTLNLGILAHVDAGKTSLTERLLYTAGVIDEIGRVDDGSTQTDTLALERQRGITIKSAVVSFVIDDPRTRQADITVNLIDTPGHPDFIAEVERVLSVLDGAVLVVSAVEGVQAQTRVLMRTLRRLRIPTLIFVNKIDRAGARPDRVLRSISERLVPEALPMRSAGTAGSIEPVGDRLIDLLSENDDGLLTAYVEHPEAVSAGRLRRELAAQTRQALVHPVFFGSAITGEGVAALISGIGEQLAPASPGNGQGPVSGTVFKVERGPAGEKIAYVRMFSGTVHVRDRVRFGDGDGDGDGKITGITVFERGGAVPRSSVTAGRIARLWGLDVQVGDPIGDGGRVGRVGVRHFPPPSLETVVVPARSEEKAAVHTALTTLAEQDPLINLRQDDIQREISVSLYGEVQKEVIQATLANDFGLDVTFRETTTICIERPIGTGAAVEIIGTESNPFLATIGLRVDPAPTGSGVAFRRDVELGSLPYSFMKTVEETVLSTLRQGLHGWEVTDCTVTMTHAGYWARQSHSHGVFDKSMSSTAGDFRNLTPLVLMDALNRAGTRVHEPVHRFRLELPADTYGQLMPLLARLDAVPGAPETRGEWYVLEGDIPAAHVRELERRLPAVTRGEGLVEAGFDHYQPVHGAAPSRPRTDHNPLDRREYLLRVVRRV